VRKVCNPIAYHAGVLYEGFDIVPEAITWCRRRITPRHPRFRFQVADIHN